MNYHFLGIAYYIVMLHSYAWQSVFNNLVGSMFNELIKNIS